MILFLHRFWKCEGGFLGGLLGGSSSKSSSTTTVESTVNVEVGNTIDTTALGEALEKYAGVQAAASAAELKQNAEIATANIALQAALAEKQGETGKLDRLAQLVTVLTGGFLLWRMFK